MEKHDLLRSKIKSVFGQIADEWETANCNHYVLENDGVRLDVYNEGVLYSLNNSNIESNIKYLKEMDSKIKELERYMYRFELQVN